MVVSTSNDGNTEAHAAASIDNLHDVVRAIETAVHDDVPMLEVVAGESGGGVGVLIFHTISIMYFEGTLKPEVLLIMTLEYPQVPYPSPFTVSSPWLLLCDRPRLFRFFILLSV
jgi:hypothetical protein